MSQSGAFSVVKFPDSSGSAVDLTTYTRNGNIPRTTNMVDLTTFQTGGARAINIQKRGAVLAPVTLNMLIDRVSWQAAMEKVGDNTGGLLQIQVGNNAYPGQSDSQFTGTETLFEVAVVVNTGAEAMMTWTFQPTDGGAVVPAWSRI